MITVSALRQKYLNFFRVREHAIVPSAGLIPENDPTTLFTSSGMQPMLQYLLGTAHPAGSRIVDAQKCFRSGEFEEVGDNRHTTFFEMLGNWSLGDYFKEQQIQWLFEFLTSGLNLPPEKLYVTVYRGNPELGLHQDTEAGKLWQQEFAKAGLEVKVLDDAWKLGLRDGRIFYYPDQKNWWSRSGPPGQMPAGEPGGPDSEVFYDFGAELNIHENSRFKANPCHVNCDCGRFMEIGNSVFMMYLKTVDGFKELPNKNIDFGGGLERLAAAAQNVQDMFLIDVFDPARSILERLSGKKYGQEALETFAFRVILDHIRAATFLIADGARPSNKDQGYFVRRLVRRAVRFAHKLGLKDNFTSEVSSAFIGKYQDAYPELAKKQQDITGEMDKEENKFRKNLERGLKIIEKIHQGIRDGSAKISLEEFDLREKFLSPMLTGKMLFDFYQEQGFPFEMSIEEFQRLGENLPETRVMALKKQYNEEMKKHQTVSRAGVETKFKGGLADHAEATTRLHTATHLLHSALRKVLGPHAAQKGSNITRERLRFDFTHPEKMSSDQIRLTEDLVNQAIVRDYPVTWEEMSVADAKKRGAFGLFEEKYADKVKVYSIGDPMLEPAASLDSLTFSKEICGGPHVSSTGLLGKFRIIKEEAVSQGVRRIKAVLE